jgi:hypothetical protein
MELEFVRDTERLVCDTLNWWQSCELATAFGWRPCFLGAKPRSYMLAKYPLNVPAEDALSFSKAIARCLFMLLNHERLSRKQVAAIMIVFSSNEVTASGICRHQAVRLASFCTRGQFRIELTISLPS